MTEPIDAHDYAAVRALAQTRANETGLDYGLEKIGGCWRIFGLPQKQFRFGHELRCEVVMCEDLSKYKPGHGPMAKHYGE